MKRLSSVWVALLLLGTLGLCYANALDNAFHLDDVYRIIDNPGIQSFWPPWRHFFDPTTSSTQPTIVQYRPLLPLSLSIDYAIAGESERAFRIGNLLWAWLASTLLYALVVELLSSWSGDGHMAGKPWLRPAALLAALAFALHPISGIPINYLCARDLLMMQAFSLASLLSYVRMRRLGETWWRWAACLGWLAAALLSKTNAVALPLYVLAFEVLVAKSSLRGTVLRVMGVGLVVLAFFAWTRWGLGFSDLSQVSAPTPWWSYAWTQFEVHAGRYIPHLVLPIGLQVEPRVKAAGIASALAWVGLVALLASIVLAWALRRRSPLVSLAVAGYWFAMLPSSSVVPLHALANDYRPYAAMPFFALGLAVLAHAAATRALGAADGAGSVRGVWLRLLPLTVLLLFFAVTSFANNRIWRSGMTLWAHSVARGTTALGHLNYAMSLPAGDERREHLAEALSINPNFTLARVNYGRLLVWQGAKAEGLAEVETACRKHPASARARYWLGKTYDELGRAGDAREAYVAAADLDPKNLTYQIAAAKSLQEASRFEDSLRFLGRVRERQASYGQAGFFEGFALQQLGRLEPAIMAYLRYLEHDEDDAQVWFNLGHARVELREWEAAATALHKALALRSDFAECHYQLARCYDGLGDAKRAAEQRKLWNARR